MSDELDDQPAHTGIDQSRRELLKKRAVLRQIADMRRKLDEIKARAG